MASCEVCGKPTAAEHNKRCSRECYYASRIGKRQGGRVVGSGRPRPPCLICGKTTKRWDLKYCSNTCYGIARQGVSRPQAFKRFKKVCPSCGIEFEVGGALKHPWTKFCSRQCAGVALRKPRHQSLSDNTHAWRAIRERILERDSHMCRACGIGTRLQVHHIDPRKYGGGDEDSNLMSVCRHCHGALDRVAQLFEGKGVLDQHLEVVRAVFMPEV